MKHLIARIIPKILNGTLGTKCGHGAPLNIPNMVDAVFNATIRMHHEFLSLASFEFYFGLSHYSGENHMLRSKSLHSLMLIWLLAFMLMLQLTKFNLPFHVFALQLLNFLVFSALLFIEYTLICQYLSLDLCACVMDVLSIID